MRTTNISCPHDLAFKSAMNDNRVARDFFENNLPAYIKNSIKLDTLKIHKETFVDAELTVGVVDILYSVESLKSKEFFYILVEHQSTPKKLMPLRMINYIYRITMAHLKQNKSKTLPVIFPMVFYNGKSIYPYSRDIFKLYGKNEKLARKIMLKPFWLHDLNTMPDEKIKQQAWAGLMQLFMKRIRSPDILPVLEDTDRFFHTLIQEDAENYLVSMINYIIEAGEINDKKAFNDKLKKLLTPQLKERAMTYAEMCRTEGRQKGRQEGRKQGMLVGIAKGESTILLRLLNRKFKLIPNYYRQKIEKASSKQLLMWGEKILEAVTIEDIFAA